MLPAAPCLQKQKTTDKCLCGSVGGVQEVAWLPVAETFRCKCASDAVNDGTLGQVAAVAHSLAMLVVSGGIPVHANE